jgi:APA family basic amino acid/polyamine antiporter
MVYDHSYSYHGPWNRKPVVAPVRRCTDVNAANDDDRNKFTLIDLISIGVGGTIGSGIFVLTGFVAHTYAGPATFISFALSGVAALASAPSYAEFAAQLPDSNGSTYAFCFVSMGEYAAVIAGACLTLEYGVSGAAVARSWGDKVKEWWMSSLEDQELQQQQERSETGDHLDGGTISLFNPLAGIITLLSTVILAYGIQESKRVTHFFTFLKVCLVCFMIIGGLTLFQIDNFDLPPLIKPELGGFDGVLRGATSSFFGYLGFDQVCCMAADAKRPGDPSKAAMWTLAIVTTFYILASIALTGMLPSGQISDTSGFPLAFESRNITWAARLTAAGEVVTLPVVVLISLLAQPRLFAAMARDGLLPEIFARTTLSGNLFWSSILCGVPMSLLAAFVPFSSLDDAISVGILVAFNMTNTSLILMKCSSNNNVDTDIDNSYHDVTGNYRDADGSVEMTTTGGNALPRSVSDPSSSSSSVNPSHQRRRSAPVGPSSSSLPSQRIGGNEMDGIAMNGRSDSTSEISLVAHLILFHVAAFLSGLTSHLTRRKAFFLDNTDGNMASDMSNNDSWKLSIQVGSMAIVLVYALYLHRRFPNTGRFGHNKHAKVVTRHDSNVAGAQNPDSGSGDYDDCDQGHVGVGHGESYIPFEAPMVPLLPLLGNYLNWYLIAQLDKSGLILLMLFLSVISILYFVCVNGRPNKKNTMTTAIAIDGHHRLQQALNYYPIHTVDVHDDIDA